jgi:NADPH-dependent glutamate synthase beta subunit-like oxidoreductase
MIETEKPVFVHLLPPCNHACAAGEDIQSWMQLAGAGDYHGAWKSLVRYNPLPAVMGRVCYHPCESDCNRTHFDQPVNIHAVERFLGDQAIRHGWQLETSAPDSGRRVLVIGAGPGGLSAAYHLRRLGHRVAIWEAAPQAGGMMRFGIPRYRLPRNILDAEIARIEAMGVDIKLNAKVDDLAAVRKQEPFDAVFLAVGAHLARRAYIPAQDAGRILDALSVLRNVEGGVTPKLGRRVLVYGGGNTALDAARTVKRLGASEALIIYRRTREKMPAQDFEVQEALQEGVQFKWLSTIHAAGENSFTIEKMSLDETGFPRPTGEYETIAGDNVVLALGQDVDLGFLKRMEGLVVENGVVKVDEHMMTGCPGVFAGGDMAPGDRTVTSAVGHGKKAARNIDAYLRGSEYRGLARPGVATFARLNMRHYAHAPRTAERVALTPEQRLSSFDEVMAGLDETNALFESRRCLSCGNCHECDNCYKVCPGDAIEKLGAGNGYRFIYDNCDGCGLCAEECPCGAIDMQVN